MRRALTLSDAGFLRRWPVARRRSGTSWLAWTLCGLDLLLLVPILVLGNLNRHAPDVWKIADPYMVVGGVAYGLVGALIVTRRPGNRLGWLFLGMGLPAQIGSLGAAWAVYSLETRPGLPGGAWGLWLSIWLSTVVLAPMFPLLLFPSGRIEDRRTRVVAGLTVVVSAALLFSLMSGTTVPPGFPPLFERTPNPLFPGDPIGDPGLGIISLGICGLLSAGLLLARYRASRGAVRQQYTWVVLSMIILVLAYIADFVARGVFGRGFVVTAPLLSLSIALVPVAMGIAILRYHLWDIDVIVNRTLVYLTLSASVVATYVFTVAWLGTLFKHGGHLFFSLVATGVVAIFFQPLREQIQRQVNRLLYGERDEPYAVIARLGQRLESTLAADAVLPAIAGTIREALKLPYAAVTLSGGVGPTVTVASGTPVPAPLRLPLVYQREQVGELQLGPRAPGEAFGAADRRLLEDLARQAGIAVHAVQLARELQQARARLVETREEERRRLRRDLHDGLGSQLAALNLQWGALPLLIDRDPSAAKEEVAELRGQLRDAISSIRTLVHGLRPPAIDELGLRVALQERLRQYQGDGLVVQAALPAFLPELPAAVEVAVYRIVEEALTNVTRHAQAVWCAVRLRVEDVVVLEIEDDGVGIGPDIHAGVGLLSMRERAEELGGRCTIESRPGGGTVVVVRLPFERKDDARE